MKTSIARRIDGVGRLVIPIKIRQALCIEQGDYLAVRVDGSTIRLSPYAPECALCGSRKNLRLLTDKPLCGDCIAAIVRRA